MPESKIHSFIVKIWIEESDDETLRVVWRGYITHVPGGERRYLKKLADIADFITGYLKESGVETDPSRVMRWLKRLNSS